MSADILQFGRQPSSSRKEEEEAPYSLEVITLNRQGRCDGGGILHDAHGSNMLEVLQDTLNNCKAAQAAGNLTGLQNITSLTITIRST